MTSTTSPSQQSIPSPNLTVLPPLDIDPSAKRPTTSRQRSSSFSKDRLSTHSNVSHVSQNRSRPGSHVFPIFHSSLPYALVRDFAYPSTHALHYGPLPPRASGEATPVSEQRRLSDPPAPWDSSRGQWSTGPWSTDHSYGHQQLPAMSFGDGPPYSEDEDLHSPVFSVPRHRKMKSTGTDLNGGRGRSPASHGISGAETSEMDRGQLVSMNADGSETYYVDDEDEADDGPGGEFITYPANESRYSHMGSYSGHEGQNFQQYEGENNFSGDRYSRDFQFAVGCPDEEMHGKAVALFDFTREHENELPLTEGQVIFVSYRHGQGWLVAEDPGTGESGLVPEEFVRLLRDIEGGLTSLNGEAEGEEESTQLSTDLSDVHLSSPAVDASQSAKETESALNGTKEDNAKDTTGSNDTKNPSTESKPDTSGEDEQHGEKNSDQTGQGDVTKT